MSEADPTAITETLTSAFSSKGPPGTPQGTVLVSDDDAATRMLLRAVLESCSFTVVEAVNGQHAYEAALRHRPDLVLIDWMMPIMDGHTTTQRLKANPVTKCIPVVMLTSRSEVEDKIEALRAGVQDFITKPFSPGELVARIEQQIRWRTLLNTESSVPDEPPPGILQTPYDAHLSDKDLWHRAIEASRSGKPYETLSLFLAEAERCEDEQTYVRAATAYRCAALVAAQMDDQELPTRLLRLAGTMYLREADTTSDEQSTQNAHLSAAHCFLLTGNLPMRKAAPETVGSSQA